MMWPVTRRALGKPAAAFSPLRLARLTSRDADALVEPLLREYVAWIAYRIAADFRIRLDNATIERHHASFRLEMPKLLRERGRLMLATLGDEPIGVGALKPIDANTAEIKRMYVRPEARGRGIGRALLERLVDDARAEGYAVARLETLVFMDEAHALYRSLGFTEIEAFEHSEAAMVGLERATYYMELPLQPNEM